VVQSIFVVIVVDAIAAICSAWRWGGDGGAGERRIRSADEPIIEVRGVRNQFGAQVVHDQLDLDVRRGEILSVVGGSGTASRCCCVRSSACAEPDAGSVLVFGVDGCCATAEDRAASRSSAASACCSRTARCSRR
jgi:ABC-type glutathione transport system ATPase component